jgi:hypothetical protein
VIALPRVSANTEKVCPLVTLMELLRIYAELFVQKTYHLGLSIDRLANPQETSIWQDAEHRAYLCAGLENLSEGCARSELPMTKLKADHVIGCLKQFDDPSNPLGKAIANTLPDRMVAHYLHEIRDRLIDELSTKIFFQLPHSRKGLFENPRESWEQIIDRFPESTIDIEESAKCFALSRYTASVFHSVQIIEHGLIQLGVFLNAKDPISGWTAVANELKRIVNKKHTERTEFEKAHFQFIEQMHGTVEALKNAWRNKISHAQGRLALMSADFSPDIAEEIRSATRAFMRRLATDLPDGIKI